MVVVFSFCQFGQICSDSKREVCANVYRDWMYKAVSDSGVFVL